MKKNPTWKKTLSWLAISFLLIAGSAWFESGSLKVALLAALWASIIKTPVYSIHEALWGRVIFSKEEEPEPVILNAICEAEQAA